MATIRAYTTIGQSRKLAEILPLESADMEYLAIKENGELIGCVPFVKDDSEVEDSAYNQIYDRIPCWSLAALIEVLPNSIYDNTNEFSQLEFTKKSVAYYDMNDGIKIGSLKDNLIDACVEMILKLHELKML